MSKNFSVWRQAGQNIEVGGEFGVIYIYMNLGLIQSLETFKKISVGGWWVGGGGFTVSLVFCFGPKIWFRT